MARLFRLLKKHFLISLSNTGLGIVFTWLIGPYLAINNHTYFQTIAQKTVTSMLIFALWLGYFLLRYPAISDSIPKDKHRDHANDVNHQEIKALWARLKQLDSNLPAQLPVYLLLGENQVGKNALMQSGQCLYMNQQLGEILSTNTMRWWRGDGMLFATPKQDLSNAEWSEWLELFARWQHKLPLIGIAAIIDAPSLCNRRQVLQKNHQQYLKQFLSVINPATTKLPLHFIVSKCDLIQGFTEFFSDLGSEERLERFGINLVDNQKSKHGIKFISEQGQAFIQRLSERLIWRAHQETDIDRRQALYNFPTQMTAINDTLQDLIAHLPNQFEQYIEGIYFTSSMQHGIPQNQLMHAVGAELNFAPSSSNVDMARHKPYFVNDTLQILKTLGQFYLPSKRKAATWQLAAYPVAAVLLSIIMFGLNHSYEKNNRLIATVNHQLLDFAATQHNDNPALTKLNALNVAYNSLVNQEAKTDAWVVLNQAKTLTEETDHAYHASLQSILMPILDNQIQHALQEGTNSSPAETYAALKTYFMLTNPHIRNRQAVVSWYQQYWHNHLNDQSRLSDELTHHLNNLLISPGIRWPTHPQLVQSAQQQLQALSPKALGMFLLKQRTSDQAVPILLKDTTHHTTAPTDSIPAIYSKAYFHQTYEDAIPKVTAMIEHGDWIIGNQLALNDKQTQALTTELRAQYLRDYHDYWQDIYNAIRFKDASDLSSIDKQLQDLQNPQSIFWQWLQLITDNTLPTKDNALFNDQVSQGFAVLHELSQDHSALADLNPEFDAFHKLLQSITQAHDSNKASYALAVQRFESEHPKDAFSALNEAAEDLPKPIQQWVKGLLTQSWQIMLANSRQYLNDIWTKNVLPEYDQKINGKFPLFASAKANISRQDFNNFFAPSGTIDAYFNYYLKPFVDTSHFYWHWKKVDGATLGIPQPTLETFIRASLITRMFYDDNGQLMVKFRLTPLSLSNNSDAMQLTVDGQDIVFDKLNKQPTDLIWPGDQKSRIKLQFFTKDAGDNAVYIDSGDWALFRFFDHSHLVKTDSATQYFVSFKLGHYKARYQLDAAQLVNPFIPDILSSFRAPESLTGN